MNQETAANLEQLALQSVREIAGDGSIEQVGVGVRSMSIIGRPITPRFWWINPASPKALGWFGSDSAKN